MQSASATVAVPEKQQYIGGTHTYLGHSLTKGPYNGEYNTQPPPNVVKTCLYGNHRRGCQISKSHVRKRYGYGFLVTSDFKNF